MANDTFEVPHSIKYQPATLSKVIAPEEIVHPDVDEHSVMTYLSQFPKAKLKPGAPLRPKQLFPDKAKAYGPGGWKEWTEITSLKVIITVTDYSLK